jgi:hypothetical protein
LRARFSPQQCLKAKGRQTRLPALGQLLFGKPGDIVVLEAFKQRVRGMKGLYPHFAAMDLRQVGVSARPPGGL